MMDWIFGVQIPSAWTFWISGDMVYRRDHHGVVWRRRADGFGRWVRVDACRDAKGGFSGGNSQK